MHMKYEMQMSMKEKTDAHEKAKYVHACGSADAYL